MSLNITVRNSWAKQKCYVLLKMYYSVGESIKVGDVRVGFVQHNVVVRVKMNWQLKWESGTRGS